MGGQKGYWRRAAPGLWPDRSGLSRKARILKQKRGKDQTEERDQKERAKFSKNKKERTAARKHGLSGGCLSVRRVEVLIPIPFCVSAGSIFGSSEPYDGGSLCHDPLQLPGWPETAMPARIRPLTFQQDFIPGPDFKFVPPLLCGRSFRSRRESLPGTARSCPRLFLSGRSGRGEAQGPFLSRLRAVKAPRKIFFRKLVKSGRICLRLCYNRSEICEQMFS